MSSLPITYTIDETLKLITDRADGAPDVAALFYLKVYRRPQQFGRASEHAATFGNASVIHFGQIEAWLPSIFGGGDYEVTAFDPADPGKRIGSMIVVSYPGERKAKPDFARLQGADWKGPRSLVYPNVEDLKPTNGVTQAGATVVIGGGTSNGAPLPGVPTAPSAIPDWVLREREEAARRLQTLELQVERERAERKAAEKTAELKQEMERVRAENDRRMHELEAKLSQKPGPTTIETVVAVATALTPILTVFMSSQEKARQLEAESRREMQTVQQTMLAKLAEPKGMPPEMAMLLEVMKSNAGASGEMMSRMVEAMSAINGMSVSMIETMAANLGGQEGNPVIDGVKDIIKAVATVQRGAEGGARRSAQALIQPPQLQQQQIPMPASVPQYPGYPPGVRPPQPVAAQPHPQAPVAAQATGPQGFAGFPVVPQSTTAAIEGMIRNHEPPDQVVDFLISKIETRDQELGEALTAVDGNVETLLASRLGAWAIVTENSNYLEKLADSWTAKASEKGFLEGAPEGEVDDDGVEGAAAT